MPVFTAEERERLRQTLVSTARADPHVIGAAHLGSAAMGRVDRWSDIDLALCLSLEVSTNTLISDWTDRMYGVHGAVTHLDFWQQTTLYRVFLLENTLQVDLSFWSPAAFGAIGPAFQLVFGSASEQPFPPPPAANHLIGMAWLYALHVRSSIHRGRVWQAQHMLNTMLDHVLMLACLRHGLPTRDGRGIDELPSAVTALLSAALVGSLESSELWRAFGVTINALCTEIDHHDAVLAERLIGPLNQMAH